MREHDSDQAPAGGRRRPHAAAARTERVTIRLSPDELAAIERRAKAFGMATAAYIAQTAVVGARDPEQLPLELGLADERARLLRALLVLHGDLRRAVVSGVAPAEVGEIAERIDELALEAVTAMKRGD